MVGELGHEREPEPARAAVLEAVGRLELARSFYLHLEPVAVDTARTFTSPLTGRMLDGVGHGLGAGHGDIERALFGETGGGG